MTGKKQWMTVTEACQALDMTERTVRRYIKEGKYPSKLENGRRVVCVTVDDTEQADTMPPVMVQMRDELAFVREELQARNRHIERLEAELSEVRKRSDTIVMQLSKTVEQQQSQLKDQTVLIADLRQPRPLWDRLFRRQSREVQDAVS